MSLWRVVTIPAAPDTTVLLRSHSTTLVLLPQPTLLVWIKHPYPPRSSHSRPGYIPVAAATLPRRRPGSTNTNADTNNPSIARTALHFSCIATASRARFMQGIGRRHSLPQASRGSSTTIPTPTNPAALQCGSSRSHDEFRFPASPPPGRRHRCRRRSSSRRPVSRFSDAPRLGHR